MVKNGLSQQARTIVNFSMRKRRKIITSNKREIKDFEKREKRRSFSFWKQSNVLYLRNLSLQEKVNPDAFA